MHSPQRLPAVGDLYLTPVRPLPSPPGPSEAEGFQLEVSGLLSELACPISVLTSGDVSQRLLNKTNCCLLLSKERRGEALAKCLISGSL